jgi:DNA-binding protein H-NS
MAKSLSDLLAQKAALEKQIADFQKEKRGDAIAKVKALMAEYGLTAADIAGAKVAAKVAAKAPAPAAAPAAAPAKKSKAAGKKVAAKYRNPATGDTWSGRGLKPKWLVAAMATGKTLADFSI